MESSRTPRFTVIIPTKDRAPYLRHTLRTCWNQDYENLEVIVSDDGSTDGTREVVEAAARQDPRIRYVTPGATRGMRDNFEFALDQVKPGFVLALGGDDGLMPHGIRGMNEVLSETGQELLAWPAPVFTYPGARVKTGLLTIMRQKGRKVVRSVDFLARQVRTLNYLGDLESPMFYVKGVTSMALVERVRRRTPGGRFYNCPTPDGYSGIVLAGEVETYAYSGVPFSLHGVSPTSQGMGYLTSDAEAKKRSETFFRQVALTPMHRELAEQPYSPLISLMTADYVLSCRDLPGWPGRFPPIDWRRLLERSLFELAHGLFAEDRVARELRILDRIAEQHGLAAFFRERVRRGRRRQPKAPLEGNAVSGQAVHLDPSLYGIEDVFDAAYVAHYAHAILPRLTPSVLGRMLLNSLGYRLRSLRKGGPFPPQSEWCDVGAQEAPTP